MESNQLGEFLREKRLKAGFSQVKIADQIGYTNAVISAAETGARPASKPLIRELTRVLHLSSEDVNHIQELRRLDKGILPSDITEYLTKNDGARDFIRIADSLGYSSDEWKKLIRKVISKHYVLLCESEAGKGTRLQESIAQIEKRRIEYVPLNDSRIYQFQFFDSVDKIEDLAVRNGHKENISKWYYIGLMQELKQYISEHSFSETTLRDSIKYWESNGINTVVVNDVDGTPVGITPQDVEYVFEPKVREKCVHSVMKRMYMQE